MSARASKKYAFSRPDAIRWRRFLTNSPPIDDLLEIRRLHTNKTIMRLRAEVPPALAARSSAWRPY